MLAHDERGDGLGGPRKVPSRHTAILIAVTVQVVFLAIGLADLSTLAVQPYERVLVGQVLSPEDMVFRDTELPVQRGTPQPPVNVAEAVRPSQGAVGQGKQLYQQYCVGCHGSDGRGDGPAAAALSPKPTNFTSLKGWVDGTRLTDIFRIITLGIPGTAMPTFDYVPPLDRFALAHYIVSLAPGHPSETPETLAALDREFHLSEATRRPSTEPLSTAMEQMLAEAPRPVALSDTALARIDRLEPRGAMLYDRVTNPTTRGALAYWLTEDSSWATDPARFRALAESGAPSNGFTPDVELLTAGDWLSLYRYLTLRYRPSTAAGAQSRAMGGRAPSEGR